MWRAASRTCRGNKIPGVIWRTSRSIGTDNGRMAVAITQLHVLARRIASTFRPRKQIFRKLVALGFAFRRAPSDGRSAPQKRRLMISAIGIGDTGYTHRHSFRSIGFEQPISAPTIDHSGKLPSQVDRVAQSGIHPKTAGGRALMHGVTGKKDSPAAIAFRHQSAPLPRPPREYLIRKVSAH